MSYVPLDAIDGSPRGRILRVLLWHDWMTPLDVGDLLNESDPGTRNTLYKAMGRLVKEGLVETRGVTKGTSAGEYRITPAGKVIADMYRVGQMPPMRQRKAA